MGMIPELPIAMLACARLGAPHTVVFGGFSSDSLSDRLNDMDCELLITQDEGLRNGAHGAAQAQRRRRARRLARREEGVVFRRTGGDVEMDDGRDLWWHELVAGGRAATPRRARASRWTPRTCSTSSTRAARPPSRRESSTRPPATSSAPRRRTTTSSTSSPTRCTGARPTSAGSPATATSSTGRSATAPRASCTRAFRTIPDKDRWWAIVERYKVDILYTAPTAIRTHMKWGPEYAAKHDLSSLRLLGSVGEPINPEAWVWYREHIGGDRTPIVDTWWQTETGMILITPLPGVTTLEARLGDASVPWHRRRGLRRAGERGRPGRRRLPRPAPPWPAMLRGIHNDDERYRETYWSRYRGRATSRVTARVATGRRLLAARPRGRRHERLRPPDLDDRGRERAGRPPARGRGGGLRALGRPHRARRSSRT